ncbi:tape measure protein, partial [Caldimonas tepidiphila]|uniref:tape measure protein n=1 Tax=Caldimonas tepidiphila TaxID=2315841 RepID=UPI001300A5BF
MSTTDIGIRLNVSGEAQVRQAFAGVEGQLERLTGAIGRVAHYGAALFALVPAAVGMASGAVRAADAVTTLQNSLKLATGSARAAGEAYEALFEIAQRSRTGFAELGETYASISRAGQALGLSQERLLGITEAIGNAMTISGGSAASMQAALTQLSQGLASGTLRGDELNSVMEQSPRLARALAEGMGVTTGELRKLGEQGAITAEKVINALEKSAPQLAREVQGATLTVGQAFTLLSNSTMKFIGEADQASGASSMLAGAMRALSGAIDDVGTVIRDNRESFAVIGGALAGAAAVAGVMGLAKGYGVLAGALAGLGTVLAANPVVLTLLGIGAAAGAFVVVNNAYAKSLAGMREELERLEKAGKSGGFYGSKASEEVLARRTARIEELRRRILELDPVEQQARENERQGIASMEAEADAARRLAGDLDAFRRKLSGVPDGYVKDMEELIRLNQAGVLVGDEYVAALKKQQEELLKKTGVTEKAKEAEKAAAEEAKKRQALLMGAIGLDTNYLETLERLQKMRAKGEISEDRYVAAVEKLIGSQAAAKQLTEEYKKEQKELGEAMGAVTAHAAKADAQLYATVDSLAAALKEQQERNETIGLEAGALAGVEYARAQANIELARERLYMLEIAGESPARLEALRAEIRLMEQVAEARRTGAIKAAGTEATRDAADAWRKTTDQIGQSLSDALMQGGRSAREYLVGLFRSTVLRPVIQAVVQPITGGVASMFGMPGSANAASGGSSMFSSAMPGWVAGMSSAFTSGAALAMNGGTGFALQGAGSMMANGSIGAGFAQGAGALAPWAAGVGVGVYGGRGISNGYAVRGSGNGVVNAGTAIGAIVGGPIGAAIGGAIGGLVNRAFGRKLVDAGIEGNVSEVGFDGNTYERYKGGWFRGGKTTTGALDGGTDATFDAAVGSMFAQARAYRDALGIPADALAGFVARVQISTKGKSGAEVEAELNKRFAEIGEEIAGRLIGSTGLVRQGESASAALQRLTGALTGVNPVLQQLGLRMFDVNVWGADAANSLAEAAGGLQAFQSAASAYYEAFFTDEEKLAKTTDTVRQGMAALGQAMPATRAEFRRLVEAQNLWTDSGRAAYAALMQMAPAFDAVAAAA